MKNLRSKLIVTAFIIFIFLINSQIIYSAYAASLRYYNETTGTNVNYSDKQITYTYNGRELWLTYPGILDSGTALADYEELFVRELGLKAVRKDNTITFTDGTTELVLVLGSKNVTINGVKDTMSVAPVKLKFDNTVKYYVPTRFVAETFGYDYVWVSNISTVRITKTLHLSTEEKEFAYNGSLYTIQYQNNRIFNQMPVIYYDGSVMIPAKEVLESMGCIYSEENGKLSIQKNELVLNLEENSKITYINSKKVIADFVPVKITDTFNGKSAMYVSLEFVVDMLGFPLTYSERDMCYTIVEDRLTGAAELYPDLPLIKKEKLPQDNTESFKIIKNYFEWTSEDSTATKDSGLYKVSAYALEGADVIELYGVSKKNINDFFDNGLAVFELKNIQSALETMFFDDDTATYLNYVILTTLATNTKLFVMTPLEAVWHIEEDTACARIYFVPEDTEHTLLDVLSSQKEEDSELITESNNYPDDKLIIPLPEQIDMTDISDEDNYLEKNFCINIAGNHVNYYKQCELQNPYYGVKLSNVYYDIDKKITKISFDTKSIYAYRYTYENGCLYITLGKPSDIYSKVIVLDAGHGGIDPGAMKNKIYEKNLNFKIVNTYVKDYFKNSDIKVYFTRDSDVKIELYDRAAFPSEVGADLFISVHMNANNSSSINGTEVYYSKDNNEKTETGVNSYQLAKKLVNNLSTALKSKNKGVKYSDFIVLKYNTVPAVLIELGYMTNATELANLNNPQYQKKAAETIYKTVLELFNEGLFR